MRILIVAATPPEIAPLTQRLSIGAATDANPSASRLMVRQAHHERDTHHARDTLVLSLSKDERLKKYVYRGHDVHVLVTGVGMVATAAWTAMVLAEGAYDLALNVGVCGSFAAALPPGTVVHVVSDRISELGAEDDEQFLAVEALGLGAEHAFVNAAPPDVAALRRLPVAHGITVNAVHGRASSIAEIVRRLHPDVESMEGAGFMQACQIHGVVFAQIRGVSNAVERRNRGAWKLDDAIAEVGRIALEILDSL